MIPRVTLPLSGLDFGVTRLESIRGDHTERLKPRLIGYVITVIVS